MPKLVMMPPLDELKREFAVRLPTDVPEYEVVVPETEEEARREIGDADAAYGWISPELLPLAGKLQWLQNPDAGPVAGYFYPAMNDHPLVICNPRRLTGCCPRLWISTHSVWMSSDSGDCGSYMISVITNEGRGCGSRSRAGSRAGAGSFFGAGSRRGGAAAVNDNNRNDDRTTKPTRWRICYLP